MAKEPMGRVLPFSKSAEEVRILASRNQEQGNLLTAIELLRVSLRKSPSDPETLLAIAETYAAMQCWTQSNSAYFALAAKEGYEAASFYGMGMNFYSMQSYGTAHDCFVLSLQKDPDAVFAPDVVDILDAIEESGMEATPSQLVAQKRMDRVLDAMDRGKARLASRGIRRVLPLDKKGGSIRSLQAFALLAAEEPRQALEAARKAYRADKTDIRSVCAMASALKAVGSMDAATAFLARAQALIQRSDDLYLVCQTACEMGDHAFVATELLKAEGRMPYAEDLLHPLATALYNTGEREEAMRRWRILRRIDPMDAVAEYRLRMAEEEKLPDELSYARQLPLSEMLVRLDTLRVWVHDGPEMMRAKWYADDDMMALIQWGIASGEPGIPQAMCGVLTTLGGEKAQALLRNILCDVKAADNVKHSALAALYATGSTGPFYAVMNERVTLVHVSKPEGGEEEQAQARVQAILRHAYRWLDPPNGRLDAAYEVIAGIASRLDAPLDAGGKAKAVVLAYCGLTGEMSPFSTTYKKHRKIARFARQIMKETDYAAIQL